MDPSIYKSVPGRDPRSILADLRRLIQQSALKDTDQRAMMKSSGTGGGEDDLVLPDIRDLLDGLLHQLDGLTAYFNSKRDETGYRYREETLRAELDRLLTHLNMFYDPLSRFSAAGTVKPLGFVHRLIFFMTKILSRISRPLFADQLQFNAHVVQSVNTMKTLLDSFIYQQRLYNEHEVNCLETVHLIVKNIRQILEDMSGVCSRQFSGSDEFVKLALMDIFSDIDRLQQQLDKSGRSGDGTLPGAVR